LGKSNLCRAATTEKKVLALTFDDGPDKQNIPLLLDILKSEGVRATFFVLGHQVKKYVETTKRVINEGHQLANHSWSHPDFLKLDNEKIVKRELLLTSKIIEKISGNYPLFMRPPYGNISRNIIF